MSFFLIGKLVLRDWRAGELRLLLVSLVVAVGIVAGITMTVGRLQQAMMLEAASYLAADRVIEGGKPIPERFVEEASSRDLEMANTLGFSSMVVPKEDESRTQFVSVKAVDGNYPLRGTLKVAREPFTIGSATPNIPRMGTVWLDSRLFPALGVELGDTVSVGYADLVIEEVLTYEPDRGGSMWDMGPRLLMNLGDVEQTQVVQPGSRLQYKFLVAGDRADLDALFESVRSCGLISDGRTYEGRSHKSVEPWIAQNDSSLLAVHWLCYWREWQLRYPHNDTLLGISTTWVF